MKLAKASQAFLNTDCINFRFDDATAAAGPPVFPPVRTYHEVEAKYMGKIEQASREKIVVFTLTTLGQLFLIVQNAKWVVIDRQKTCLEVGVYCFCERLVRGDLRLAL